MKKKTREGRNFMKQKTLWVARTAVLLALLLVLQFVTKPLGQYVTGSCVNLVLAVAALVGGLWCGVVVAALSPFFAFLLQIAAMPIVLVPGVACGNIVLVLVLYFAAHKLVAAGEKPLLRYAAVVGAAAAKFATLWLVVTKLLLPPAGLPEQKVAVMTATFTWPQLVTALLGGLVAMMAAPVISRAVNKKA